MRTPATFIERDGESLLVLREDAPPPPSPFMLVRSTVYFEQLPEVREIKFGMIDSETETIATRFLQFLLDAPLSNNAHLWRPRAGSPFFEKHEAATFRGVARYAGFAVRVVATPNNGLGLCVDLATKYINKTPLPVNLTRPEFRRYKGQHCVYHYGHRWYEIQLREFEDVTASEFLISHNGQQRSLLTFISQESQKPLPQELAMLPNDASVILYSTNEGEYRAAPAGLCYQVHDTRFLTKAQHFGPLLSPEERYCTTRRFVEKYLQNLRFSDHTLKLSAEPVAIPRKMFMLPDYQFGNRRILSVRGTAGAEHTTLERVGKMRMALLLDKHAGFFEKDPLQRQYLVLPQTVYDSFGPSFIRDLRSTVDQLFPQSQPYEPIVVTYDDRVHRIFVHQGNAILKAARDRCSQSGFAVVMIHDTEDRRIRQHDQLAAMVIRKCREEFDICAAVIHSTVGQECYQLITKQNGSREYTSRPEKQGKLKGYLRNVALNKVLLTNNRWPFVLATPLRADMTIGIDVKLNTAGFTIVNRCGNLIRTIIKDSRQKEQLLAPQVKRLIIEAVQKEVETGSYLLPIKSVVVHRDGILWPSERFGINQALAELRRAGTLAADALHAVLEIPKKSAAPVRLYDVARHKDRITVDNPEIGTYFLLGSKDAYLCATGRAFPRPGTVQPVHVKFIEGALPFEQCLEDLFALTGLTWSRPDDCAKDPITIKLTDRRLGEDASTFDADALEFIGSEAGQEAV